MHLFLGNVAGFLSLSSYLEKDGVSGKAWIPFIPQFSPPPPTPLLPCSFPPIPPPLRSRYCRDKGEETPLVLPGVVSFLLLLCNIFSPCCKPLRKVERPTGNATLRRKIRNIYSQKWNCVYLCIFPRWVCIYCICRSIMEIYIIRSQIHERRNWERSRTVSFLGIFVSNFWYSACRLRIYLKLLRNVFFFVRSS
jgi:hypothetical protein